MSDRTRPVVAGLVTALVGTTSSFAVVLAGLRAPAVGEVDAPDAHLASQRPVILPGSVRDNLALVGGRGGGDGPTDAAMVTALERAPETAVGRLPAACNAVAGSRG